MVHHRILGILAVGLMASACASGASDPNEDATGGSSGTPMASGGTMDGATMADSGAPEGGTGTMGGTAAGGTMTNGGDPGGMMVMGGISPGGMTTGGTMGEGGTVDECPELQCELECPDGFAVRADGCPICECILVCPEADDPRVTYENENPLNCMDLELDCGDGESFRNACGCGCILADCGCTGEVEPVCGVDGMTYGNTCIAECARVEVEYEDPCEQVCPERQIWIGDRCEPMCVANVDCPRGERCNAEEACLPDPDCQGCAVCIGWCIHLGGECGEMSFQCNDGSCIRQEWVCDGLVECPDATDELMCGEGDCAPDEFQCAEGLCIPGELACNEANDCGDGSDEAECLPGGCNGEFPCADDMMCIPFLWVCDGEPDCNDASDEPADCR